MTVDFLLRLLTSSVFLWSLASGVIVHAADNENPASWWAIPLLLLWFLSAVAGVLSVLGLIWVSFPQP